MIKYLPLVFLFSCGIDREVNRLSNEDAQLVESYKELYETHQVQLNSSNESGEKLTLCLRFVDNIHKQPVSGKSIHFYHADINGNYNPTVSGDESTARLSGQAITDNKGRILLQTTLPGDYGSSSDNRHIHTTVFGARPEAYDIHFKQYTDHLGAQFINGSDQHFLADLKKDSEDNLIAILTIEVKNP
ncbi:dioxygenase family protein [Ekhidna sp.]